MIIKIKAPYQKHGQCWYCHKDIGEAQFYTGGPSPESRIHSKCLIKFSRDQDEPEAGKAVESKYNRDLQ